jgi:hypothetical protein
MIVNAKNFPQIHAALNYAWTNYTSGIRNPLAEFEVPLGWKDKLVGMETSLVAMTSEEREDLFSAYTDQKRLDALFNIHPGSSDVVNFLGAFFEKHMEHGYSAEWDI